MRIMKLGAAAALICAGFALPSLAANAMPADGSSCMKMDSQVRTALDANPNAPNRDAARSERSQAMVLCHRGHFRMGLERYAAALKLLGADQQG